MAARPHVRLVTINGETARDQAFAQVLATTDPAWKRAWQDVVYALPEGWEGTGEDIKHLCRKAGMKEPHKPQSWGAMVGGAVAQGGLRAKDPIELRKPVDMPSHASKTMVHLRTNRL